MNIILYLLSLILSVSLTNIAQSANYEHGVWEGKIEGSLAACEFMKEDIRAVVSENEVIVFLNDGWGKEYQISGSIVESGELLSDYFMWKAPTIIGPRSLKHKISGRFNKTTFKGVLRPGAHGCHARINLQLKESEKKKGVSSKETSTSTILSLTEAMTIEQETEVQIKALVAKVAEEKLKNQKLTEQLAVEREANILAVQQAETAIAAREVLVRNKRIQEALFALEKYEGEIDGNLGIKSRTALIYWKVAQGYDKSIDLTESQLAELEQDAVEFLMLRESELSAKKEAEDKAELERLAVKERERLRQVEEAQALKDKEQRKALEKLMNDPAVAFLFSEADADINLIYNDTGNAKSSIRGLSGDIEFDDGNAKVCSLSKFSTSEDMLDYMISVLQSLGVKAFDLIGICSDLDVAESDLIIVQSSDMAFDIIEESASTALLLEKLRSNEFTKFGSVKKINLEALLRRQGERSNNIKSAVADDTINGFGLLITHPEISQVFCAEQSETNGTTERVIKEMYKTLPRKLRQSDVRIIFDNLEYSFKNLKRKKCGYFFGSQESLKRISSALMRDRVKLTFHHDWWSHDKYNAMKTHPAEQIAYNDNQQEIDSGNKVISMSSNVETLHSSDLSASDTIISSAGLKSLSEVISTPTFEIKIIDHGITTQVGTDYFETVVSDGGIFFTLYYSYKNISGRPIEINMFSGEGTINAKLRDANGINYEPDSGASGHYGMEVNVTEKIISNHNPDITLKKVHVFEISKVAWNKNEWTLILEADQVIEYGIK